jgi:hypothetical protein
VVDVVELGFGASPLVTDSDADGLTDRFEIFELAGLTMPNTRDTARDGTADGDGDNPGYVAAMHDWIMSNNVVYQTITDYCPHGVWRCERNPRATAVYRDLFGNSD